MQALASRRWSREARHHPGQLAWSMAYGEPEALDLGPVLVLDEAWAWLESPEWLEACGTEQEAVRAVVAAAIDATDGDVTTSTLETEAVVVSALADAGFTEVEAPWFTHHHLDLADVPPVVLPPGYTVRAVLPDEHEQRAAVHRDAWSATSKVTGVAYRRLMATPPYRPGLDHVVLRVVGRGDGRRARRTGRLRPRAPGARPGGRRLGLRPHCRPRPRCDRGTGLPARRRRLSRTGPALPRDRVRGGSTDPHVPPLGPRVKDGSWSS